MPAAMHLPQLRDRPCVALTLALALAAAASILTSLPAA